MLWGRPIFPISGSTVNLFIAIVLFQCGCVVVFKGEKKQVLTSESKREVLRLQTAKMLAKWAALLKRRQTMSLLWMKGGEKLDPLERQRFTHFKKASASTKHEYNQALLKRSCNLFHLTKTRPGFHCVLRVEGHWSMPRTGNSSEFNTLSAQFIYCCVSNGQGYCESTWKKGTKAPPYATENSGHKEGASLLNRS